ncbi:MAG: hypothetical protein WCC22_15605 [Terriglobales bacterium]
MKNITQALIRLRDERRQALKQVARISEAISVLERLTRVQSSSRLPLRAKRVLSAAGRRRISLAQKARWAKVRQLKKAA